MQVGDSIGEIIMQLADLRCVRRNAFFTFCLLFVKWKMKEIQFIKSDKLKSLEQFTTIETQL